MWLNQSKILLTSQCKEKVTIWHWNIIWTIYPTLSNTHAEFYAHLAKFRSESIAKKESKYSRQQDDIHKHKLRANTHRWLQFRDDCLCQCGANVNGYSNAKLLIAMYLKTFLNSETVSNRLNPKHKRSWWEPKQSFKTTWRE